MRPSAHGAEEPSIVDLESGKLLTVLRTSTGNRLQISLPRRSENVDEAKTWTKPVPTGLAPPLGPRCSSGCPARMT